MYSKVEYDGMMHFYFKYVVKKYKRTTNYFWKVHKSLQYVTTLKINIPLEQKHLSFQNNLKGVWWQISG